MPKCALNEDTDDPSDWVGTDDDNWLMRWRIKKKHWFAFANRCPPGLTWTLVFLPGLYLMPLTIWFTGWSWWYLFPIAVLPVARRWRLLPTTVWAIRGPGLWRYESTDSKEIVASESLHLQPEKFYLSRVQYWCRWHFAIQWPLCLQFHVYYKPSNVLKFQEQRDTDGQLLFLYRGWHRDEDEIYWGDGGFIGTGWK
jgi:hypothetical protein